VLEGSCEALFDSLGKLGKPVWNETTIQHYLQVVTGAYPFSEKHCVALFCCSLRMKLS